MKNVLGQDFISKTFFFLIFLILFHISQPLEVLSESPDFLLDFPDSEDTLLDINNDKKAKPWRNQELSNTWIQKKIEDQTLD